MAGPSVDVLPDELAPVETVDDIVDVVDTAYADVIGTPPQRSLRRDLSGSDPTDHQGPGRHDRERRGDHGGDRR